MMTRRCKKIQFIGFLLFFLSTPASAQLAFEHIEPYFNTGSEVTQTTEQRIKLLRSILGSVDNKGDDNLYKFLAAHGVNSFAEANDLVSTMVHKMDRGESFTKLEKALYSIFMTYIFNDMTSRATGHHAYQILVSRGPVLLSRGAHAQFKQVEKIQALVYQYNKIVDRIPHGKSMPLVHTWDYLTARKLIYDIGISLDSATTYYRPEKGKNVDDSKQTLESLRSAVESLVLDKNFNGGLTFISPYENKFSAIKMLAIKFISELKAGSNKFKARWPSDILLKVRPIDEIDVKANYSPYIKLAEDNGISQKDVLKSLILGDLHYSGALESDGLGKNMENLAVKNKSYTKLLFESGQDQSSLIDDLVSDLVSTSKRDPIDFKKIFKITTFLMTIPKDKLNKNQVRMIVSKVTEAYQNIFRKNPKVFPLLLSKWTMAWEKIESKTFRWLSFGSKKSPILIQKILSIISKQQKNWKSLDEFLLLMRQAGKSVRARPEIKAKAFIENLKILKHENSNIKYRVLLGDLVQSILSGDYYHTTNDLKKVSTQQRKALLADVAKLLVSECSNAPEFCYQYISPVFKNPYARLFRKGKSSVKLAMDFWLAISDQIESGNLKAPPSKDGDLYLVPISIFYLKSRANLILLALPRKRHMIDYLALFPIGSKVYTLKTF